jgi:hypothetical protein
MRRTSVHFRRPVRARDARVLGAALGACVALAGVAARASSHEAYAQAGGTYYASPARVFAGLGAGAGYRVHLASWLALYAEARYVALVGHAGAFAAGALVHVRVRAWDPAVGAHAVVIVGDQVRVVTPQEPDPLPPVMWALQLRLQPVRFTHQRFSVATLGVDVGFGVDRGAGALALSVTLLEVGYRF